MNDEFQELLDALAAAPRRERGAVWGKRNMSTVKDRIARQIKELERQIDDLADKDRLFRWYEETIERDATLRKIAGE